MRRPSLRGLLARLVSIDDYSGSCRPGCHGRSIAIELSQGGKHVIMRVQHNMATRATAAHASDCPPPAARCNEEVIRRTVTGS